MNSVELRGEGLAAALEVGHIVNFFEPAAVKFDRRYLSGRRIDRYYRNKRHANEAAK